MNNKIPMVIITLHYILAGALKIWESTTQEQSPRVVSLVMGLLIIVIGLGLVTRKKIFTISALVLTWLPLLLMPFVMVVFFMELKFASVIAYIFFVPFLMWEFSVLRKELKINPTIQSRVLPETRAFHSSPH